jgi:DNA-binding NarL/FixJ family response regulator
MTGSAANELPDEEQRRVLVLMARYDDHAIARRLGISVTTVRRRFKAV